MPDRLRVGREAFRAAGGGDRYLTWASWLRQSDVPSWVLQEPGGWKSESMMRRYAHMLVKHLQRYADQLTFAPKIREDGEARKTAEAGGAKSTSSVQYWRTITLSQLLSHTSGLPEYLDQDNFIAVMPQELRPRQIVALGARRPRRFSPGERHEYNSTGFILLGMAAEAVKRRNYWDLLERRFFRPAGMASTGPRGRIDCSGRCASGNFWSDGRYDHNPPRSAAGSTWSAGGLPSTAADIDRWSIALDHGKILSDAVRQKMWRQAFLASGEPAGWGYGWEVETASGRTVVSHGDGTAGFSCWYRRDLAEPLSAIVLTNQNGRADPKAMIEALLGAIGSP